MAVLTAPVDGIVQGLSINTIGGVVKAADTIMTIVPDGIPLDIEAVVLNKDIGYVRSGQTAQLKFDTYPFQRYGVVNGTVTFVSSDAYDDDKLGPVYKVIVDIPQDSLNKAVKLYPGMAASVEIKTGEKRVIAFFLEPLVKYADESLNLR